jgi:hypothetical protein
MVDTLPQGPRENAAFQQIEEFQERIGRIRVERVISGGHCQRDETRPGVPRSPGLASADGRLKQPRALPESVARLLSEDQLKTRPGEISGGGRLPLGMGRGCWRQRSIMMPERPHRGLARLVGRRRTMPLVEDNGRAMDAGN